MRDLSLKRSLLLLIAFTFAATTLVADNPSARYETRMAYDPTTKHMILFGGVTGSDRGTKVPYYLGDTWEWIGFRWVQRYPKHTPPARSGQTMVNDSNRNQIVMFGGHNSKGDLNDTWVYQNSDWTQIETPDTPPARQLHGGAFDPIRDRMIIYGGTQTSADGKTFTPIHDTWEFDGTTWTKHGGEGPDVLKPILVYDAARNQVVMLAINSKVETQMYAYDPAPSAWNQLKPSTLPGCVNEGMATFQESNNTVLYTGGVCTNSSTSDETLEWDGTNWNKITLLSEAGRVFGAAMAYDANRSSVLMFGGTPVGGVPRADTYTYSGGAWLAFADVTRPGPRSLFSFTSDPVNSTIWMFGGTTDTETLSDFWRYDNGTWQAVTATGGPAGCLTPTSAFDTDRQKLVVVCASSAMFEWDGTAWKTFSDLKTPPPYRRFSSMAYDASLKKTVLFGGLDSNNRYLDETWLWDGATWQRQTQNPATSRSSAAMWFDPSLKKTVIYGGIGRITSTDRVTRFSDMWTLSSNGWTVLKPASTPGARYGAQTSVDPRTNHVLLFGGLRLDTIPSTTPGQPDTQVQVYANDMWDWDGTAWSKIAPDQTPPARENGGLAFDPSRNEIVLFGGYAGFYFSDLWTYTPTTWKLQILDPIGGRRRVAR
jgi:N-acetylneuraminic acid mutarotase